MNRKINYTSKNLSNEMLKTIGKEYITRINQIIELLNIGLTDLTDSNFVINNSMNLIRSEIEFIYENHEKVMNTGELNIITNMCQEEILKLYRRIKEIRVKLQGKYHPLSIMSYDSDVLNKHAEQYKRLYDIVVKFFDEYYSDIIQPVFDKIKEFDKIKLLKYSLDEYKALHKMIAALLEKSLTLLKSLVKNRSLIDKHIEKYRVTIRKETKINDIIKEIYKIKPVSLMRPGYRVWVKHIKEGDIFSHTLYSEDSKLVKQSYEPFTKEDIQGLKQKKIISLYRHNNLMRNILPENYNIIVVDDDEYITELLNSELSSMDFNITTYNDPELALKAIYKESPDLVLLDIEMPQMDGITFLKNMYNSEYGILPDSIPVIMVTSQKDKHYIRECLNNNAKDYITKPFLFDDLLIKITSFLDNKKSN